MKKRSLFTLIILIVSLLVPFTVSASDDDYDGYYWLIDDQADLLTDDEEEALYFYMDPLLNYGNVIFTTTTLRTGADYEAYAEDLYYDYFGNEPGVHFQIDMGNRKLTLCASTEMEKLIGKERTSIVDNIYKMAANGDYFSCAAECFDEVMTVINNGHIAHTMKYIDNGIIAFLLALILNFIVLLILGSQKTPDRKLIAGALGTAIVSHAVVTKKNLVKEYSPSSSDSDSDSSGGGGGGGGGFSGGSSSHGF